MRQNERRHGPTSIAVVERRCSIMADVGSVRKDANGKPLRAKTATASVDSRKNKTDQAVVADGDDNDTVASRRAMNVSVSDSEQPRDARKTINRSSSLAEIDSDPEAPLRLIVISSRIRNSSVMHSAILPNIVFVQYKYESATTDSCLGKFLYNGNNICFAFISSHKHYDVDIEASACILSSRYALCSAV